MEIEEYELRPGYLLGAVRALQSALRDTITNLPERAMYNIAAEARSRAKRAEEIANSVDTDVMRDYAIATFEIAEMVKEAVEHQIQYLEEGSALRTVSPHPISEEDWISPTSGY